MSEELFQKKQETVNVTKDAVNSFINIPVCVQIALDARESDQAAEHNIKSVADLAAS